MLLHIRVPDLYDRITHYLTQEERLQDCKTARLSEVQNIFTIRI
jgi:hypothetical protein